MALRLEDKKEIVASVEKEASAALSVVAFHNLGLTVQEMTELRQKGRTLGVSIRVVRNTLARRAFQPTAFACMAESSLVGPTILAFSKKEYSAAARLLRDFCKTHESIRVTALSVGGKLLAANELDFLAQLPTRDEAISQMMCVMKDAAATRFLRTTTELYTQFVRALSAVAEKKQ